MSKRVGIYGGTFDPIHVGHIHFALEMRKAVGLDEVWFCPANQNPFKKKEENTPAKHRMRMVELALEGIPGLFASDIEMRREAPSYTIDTIRTLMEEYPHTFTLLLGGDAAANLSQWKEGDTILDLVEVFVGRRKCNEKIEKKYLIETPVLEISSTAIRDSLKRGEYCSHLIPAKTMDYIHKNRLYF